MICFRPARLRLAGLRTARTLATLLVATAALAACNRSSEPENPAARAGRMAFEVCSYCHTITPDGIHKVGPNLYGVYGRAAAQSPGYDYSTALRESDLVWDEATLDAFLRSPPTVVPGAKMVNATVDPARRQAVIDYLKRHSPAATGDTPR